MIYRFVLLLLLLPGYNDSLAQLLDNSTGDIWGDNPAFDQDYVRDRGIKSIRGDVTGKKVMHAIADGGHAEFYNFYRNGKLQMYYKTIGMEFTTDTAVCFYEYDNWGRFNIIRRNDGSGYLTQNIFYNENDYVERIQHSREYNQSKSKTYFVIGGSEELYTESFQYVRSGNNLTKKFFNSAGREYQTETTTYDRNGRTTSFITKFYVSDRVTKEFFTYDLKGNLITRKVFNNWSTQSEMLYKYTYDLVGNIDEAEYYRGGVHQTHTEYLYKSGELYAKLVKDMESGYIKIVKYTFDYYH